MTCEFKKSDGTRCKANPLQGEKYCYFHHPKQAGKHRQSSAKGGKHKLIRLPSNTPAIRLRSADDVVSLIEKTVDEMRRGLISPKITNSIAFVCGTLLRAFEMGDFEKRLSELEKKQSEERDE
jgi:hypothetical protein